MAHMHQVARREATGGQGPKQHVRVTREEAVAVALEVERRTRRGESIPSWMQQVASAI